MKNGELWTDNSGTPIQAHGGCIINYGETWYWYGENKDVDNLPGKNQVPFVGISCYSSSNLRDWQFEGNVLEANKTDSGSPIHTSRVCERPKVIYNPKNKNFALWMHLDNKDYTFARAGVAVSASPTGPFEFLAVHHANRTDCRDMTVFQDTDGRAYLVHSGDWNKTLYISQLDDDFTGFTGLFTKVLVDQEREAPALLHHNGLYYLVSSGCTGWKPNSMLYAVNTQLLCGARWKLIDNPCSGPGYRQTFGAQSACIFCAGGQPYLLLDHWEPKNLRQSGYSILPIHIKGDYMEILWRDCFEGI
ncbi:MAG: glycoside hydrolase family 43 protein [Treponema sp.]|jgi:hypothetical protein|nr:glycoside hydrolase family 43 protein [Treponema sp.]